MVYGLSIVSGTGSMKKGYRKLNVWHIYTWHYAYPPKLWQLTSCVQRGHVSVYGSQLLSSCIHKPGVS